MKLLKNESNKQETLFAVELQSKHGLFAYEKYWSAQGYGAIAGTDEAGRGPLAGPVVAAAVVLPPKVNIPFLNDSKKLSPQRRESVFEAVTAKALALAWSRVEADEIDRRNIYQASRLAMMQALTAMNHPYDLVLSDAMPLPDLYVPCVPIIHGDALSASIAAASVIAKVIRDRIMGELDLQFPLYGFCRHKGYGTPEHMKALALYGPCLIHRRSFEPIKSWRSSPGEN